MKAEQIKQVLESVKNNKLTDLFLHHKRWDALPIPDRRIFLFDSETGSKLETLKN